jgi:hypothetical protein
MKFCKKLKLKRLIKKYESFLLREGVKEAKRRGKNIHMGLEGRAMINDDIYEMIYLNQNEKGQTLIAPLLALGAENRYEEGRKYFLYGEMLERMDRHL